jgi:hypothetical protein
MMRLNGSFVLVVAAALSGSVGCVVGDGNETDDVGALAANAITGPMEYDVAVYLNDDCRDWTDCNTGPYIEGKTDGTGYPLGTPGRSYVYGSGYFRKDGDSFFLGDWLFDSHSVGLNWEDAEANRQGICRLDRGGLREGECNKNLPEHDSIRYRLGRCDSDKADCTDWSSYVDVTGWQYTLNND